MDGFGEETRRERDGVQEADGWECAQIEFTVIHASTGCDEAVVAVLVGVGDRQEKRLHDAGAVGVGDFVVLRWIRTEKPEGGADVGAEAALGEAVEALADFRIETETHGIEERDAVDVARVDAAGASVEQGAEGAAAGARDAEVAAETIAGAAGDEAEGDLRADESGSDLVERAIAADGHDAGAPLGHGFARQRGRVVGRLGEDEIGVAFALPDKGLGALEDAGVSGVSAGARVVDQLEAAGEAVG